MTIKTLLGSRLIDEHKKQINYNFELFETATEDLMRDVEDLIDSHGIFGDVPNGNYSEFESDGTLKLNGDATVYDDLRFPATQLRVNPATSLPNFDYTEIGFLFDDGSTETLYIIAQMPHSWKEESTIYPHVHWMPTSTNTGSVLWRMEYKWVSIGDTTPGSFTSIDILDAADGIALKHQIAPFPAISGVGKGLSSILSIKLSRVGGDASDTYTADALLKEFDIHYEIDTLGSREEYVK